MTIHVHVPCIKCSEILISILFLVFCDDCRLDVGLDLSARITGYKVVQPMSEGLDDLVIECCHVDGIRYGY